MVWCGFGLVFNNEMVWYGFGLVSKLLAGWFRGVGVKQTGVIKYTYS